MGESFYWRAEGRSLEVVQRFFGEDERFNERAKEWVREIIDRDDVVWMARGWVVGVRAETHEAHKALAALPYMRQESARKRASFYDWTTNARTQRGKELRAKGKAIRRLDAFELAKRLYGKVQTASGGITGIQLVSVGAERVGDAWVLETHDDAPPPDAVPLKRSEYWALKEAADG